MYDDCLSSPLFNALFRRFVVRVCWEVRKDRDAEIPQPALTSTISELSLTAPFPTVGSPFGQCSLLRPSSSYTDSAADQLEVTGILRCITSCFLNILSPESSRLLHPVMDIGNILNAKGNAAAAAEARRQQQQIQLAGATPMSHRSNSDIGSEQGSTSSQPQPLHPSTNLPNRYPSPIPTAANMQMVPSDYQTGGLQENGYPQNDDPSGQQQPSDESKKSFACSHCQKKFARRSDLARHGTHDLL
jgi:hypothetical protein